MLNFYIDDNSANNMMLKRRQNPPATLTTNDTANKHNEFVFSRGMPTRSTDSKTAMGIKSLEQIENNEYEQFRMQHKASDASKLADLEERNLDDDLIVEEEDYPDFQE